MPGLMDNEAAPRGVAPEAGYTGKPGTTSAGEAPNVSPEEQAQYDKLVDNAFRLIYDKKMMPQITERLKAGGDPIEGLANVAFMVVSRLEDSANQKGAQIPQDVLFHGGVEILEDVANLAKEAGIHDYTDEEMEGALYKALDLYGQHKSQAGGFNKDAFTQDMASLIDADQSGELEREFPGLKEKFGGARDKMMQAGEGRKDG